MTLCVASSGRFFMSRTVPPFSVRPVKWNRPVPVNANRPDRPDFASSTGHRRKNGYRKIPCKKKRTSGMAYGAGYRHFGDFPLPAGIRFMGDCRDSGPVPATAWRWAKSVDSLSFPLGFLCVFISPDGFPVFIGNRAVPFCHGHSSAFRPEIAVFKRKCLKKAI